MKTRPEYQAQTAAATIQLIAEGVDPWLALGATGQPCCVCQPGMKSIKRM